jgi:hypothetical protein
MRPRKWDLAALPDIVSDSSSVREVIEKLGLIPAGGNYTQVQKAITLLELDTSHFKGQGWNKGLTFGAKRPLSAYLSNEFPIQSHGLRLRLLKEEVFPHKCNKCDRTEWNGKPIPLELEHKNGNHSDNTLSNLELLCPNCHAQTSTYRGKNIRR